ncbi:hypothetical protein [Myxococcus stipitatus]|uniref:hypothetical protein n=1 Tax=Myxococcus stipitatus TaxID=83455 RepID=UPI0030D5EFCE
MNYRGNVTGTYPSSGTIRTTVYGAPRTTPISSAFIYISEYASDIKALRIKIFPLFCPEEIEAAMTGAREFKVVRGMCWLPPPRPDCHYLVELNAGSGTTSASRLALTLKGNLTVTCGTQSTTDPVTIDFVGTHDSDSLPDTSPEAMSTQANLSTLPHVSGD